MRLQGPQIQSLEQEREFSCADLHQFCLFFRPLEAVLFKAFLEKAEAVALPIQNLDHRLPAVAENKQVATERIKIQGSFHQHGETIDGFAHIGAAQGQENAGVRGK